MKFAICCQIKNERRFIEEWCEYHLNLGFDDIYLYEDYGSESHKDLIDKYDNVHLNSIKDVGVQNHNSCVTQNQLYKKLLCDFKKEGIYDWVAFIDIDEFIMLDEGYNLEKLVSEYEDYAGIWLAWKMYNACGHIERPKGGVLENYTYPLNEKSWMCLDSSNGKYLIWNKKSIVNLHKANTWFNIHEIKGGCDINYSQNIHAPKVFKKAWINHYFTKSWEDYCDRMQRRGNMRNDLRTFDQFFIQNPELMYKKKELIEAQRNKHLSGNMYISRDMKIISGGNLGIINKLYNEYDQLYNHS